MKHRIAVATGMPESRAEQVIPAADLCIDWTSERRNALVSISEITSRCIARPDPVIRDLFDISVALYLSDIAVLRGDNEGWTRELELTIPVRDRAFWEGNAEPLSRILHQLTHDRIRLAFCHHSGNVYEFEEDTDSTPPDCVCALSGGVDSMAGATMLLRADRRPFLITHQSGNPYVRRARDRVVETLEEFRPDRLQAACATIQPRRRSDNAHAYPSPRNRETSRRSRSFLFISLSVLAAACAGVSEVYVCDNGILTIALPLSRGRIGSLSTRSTHPVVLMGMNRLLEAAGAGISVKNPFVYQTKAELIRDILRPVLSPQAIQETVSCWMTGRSSRQCGGCVPCLLRRISMLAAGLPDEAYQMDLLDKPGEYRGTDAYTNLVDLLSQARIFAGSSETEMLMRWPELLDAAAAGESAASIADMLQRYGREVMDVVSSHFPDAAKLMTPPEE